MKKMLLPLLALYSLHAETIEYCGGQNDKEAIIGLSSQIQSSVSSSVEREATQRGVGRDVDFQNYVKQHSKVSSDLDLTNIKIGKKGEVFCASVERREQEAYTKNLVNGVKNYQPSILAGSDEEKVKMLESWIDKITKTQNNLVVFGKGISEKEKIELLNRRSQFMDLRAEMLFTLENSVWKACGDDKKEAYRELTKKIFGKGEKKEEGGFLDALGGLFGSDKKDEKQVIYELKEVLYKTTDKGTCAVLKKNTLLDQARNMYATSGNFQERNLPKNPKEKHAALGEWVEYIDFTLKLMRPFKEAFLPKHHEKLISQRERLQKLKTEVSPQYVKFVVAGENVAILLDGVKKLVPNEEFYLKEGAHSYVISSMGKCDKTGAFEIAKGEDEVLEISLGDMSYPTVTFNTNMFDARASINGQLIKMNVKETIKSCAEGVPYIVSYKDQTFQGKMDLSAGEHIDKSFYFLSAQETQLFNDPKKKTFTVDTGKTLADTLSRNDIPATTKLVFEVKDAPKNGVLKLDEKRGSFTYTPADLYKGIDSFSYVIGNGDQHSAIKIVEITVKGQNHAPVALSESFNVESGKSLSSRLEAKDEDEDAIVFSYGSKPSHGEFILESDGSFTYTPFKDFKGLDSFTYKITDANNASATKSVKINVTAKNSQPEATFSAFETTAGRPYKGNLTATDRDGDGLKFLQVDMPKHGRLDLGSNGIFSYTAHADFAGEDSFAYKVSDGKDSSSVQTVTITVKALPAETKPSKVETPDMAMAAVAEVEEGIDYEMFKKVLEENAQNTEFILKTKEQYPKAFAKFLKEKLGG